MINPTFKFPISGNLNKSGIVTNTAGLVFLGTLGYVAVRCVKDGFSKRLGGALLLSATPAIVYLYLDSKEYKRESEEKDKDREQERYLARLRHSGSTSSNGELDEEEDKDEPMKPVVQSIGQVVNNSGITRGSYDDNQLIGKYIYKGDKVVVYSSYGVGKTCWTMQVALDLSNGVISKIAPDDKGIHSPSRVIYYDGEMDDADYVKIFGTTKIANDNLCLIRGFYFPTIDEWLKDVKSRLDNSTKDTVVILDNISCVCSTAIADRMRKLFLEQLEVIKAKYQGITITFIIVAHTNKDLELFGSNNTNNFATSVIRLENDGANVRMTIQKCRKYGDMQNKSITLLRKETEEGYKYFECAHNAVVAPDNTPPKNQREETNDKVCEIFNKIQAKDGNVSELCAEYGISRQTYYERLKELKLTEGEPE